MAMSDVSSSPHAEGVGPEAALEDAASGTDADRLAALEELYRALEIELEEHGGQARPPRH